MKKIKSLNVYMVLLVLFIMVMSSIMSAIILILLFKINLLSHDQLTPLVISFIALLVSIILGICISAFVGKRILKPMNELIQATKIVAKGDFSVRVTEVDNIILADLLKSFNIMIEELGSIELFRKNFINNFSHEFKTPIVSIRGFAKQLTMDSITDDLRKEYANIIVHEAERLTSISSNILLLTKFEHQQIISDQNIFDLDEQIRRCIILLEPQWSKKNLEFILDLEDMSYYSNEEMLSLVWINVLSNAIKFSYDHGQIYVKLRESLDNVHVEIRDQGVGIKSKDIHHIFETFYQCDSSHKEEGNGLGLSLVKRIVELCDGEIHVTSVKNSGTTFLIELPKHRNKL